MQNYRWATLGCGVIANELAQALASRGQTLYSVANRTHAKAEAFAEKYGIEKVYDQIDDVFADPDVDIIYISTPHNTHIQYLRKALAALPGSLTVFIVSQRAASLQHADQIIVLDDGRMVGLGRHADLLKTCPVYEEIYASQFKKGDAQK